MVAIVGLSIVGRHDFLNALTGDRLPIAEYLLLVGGIASFGIRTRGGLYAQLALSGLVLFFVAERAFDPTFAVFLIVFLGLFLTFFAMAFMEDQLRIAKAHWPEGQLGRFWFWMGIVGGGLLVTSALAFSLLPPDYRGNPGSQRIGVVPFMGESGLFDERALSAMEAQPPTFPEEPPTVSGFAGQDGGQFGPGALGTSALEPFEGRKVSGDPREEVMHVRSRVTSYWRGRVFEEFDGVTWYRSRSDVVRPVRRRNRNFYWQAYFLQRDEPQALFTGYTPVQIVLPEEVRQRGALTRGSTYSVLSQRPELGPRAIAADRPGWKGPELLEVPSSLERVRYLANETAGDAPTPFERLWLIISYLRQHHSYDVSAEDQLRLSGSVDDFLAGGSPGTSLDFAAATALMARAVKLPARVAVGYLPGKFDPFSGTHKVRTRDAHAWAEIYFSRNGWVAFDGTPRPELDVFTSGDLAGFGGTSFIFQTRVGGGLYRVLHSGASEAGDRVAELLEGRSGLFGPAVAVIVLIVVAWVAFWALRRRSHGTRRQWQYSRLPGRDRREILKAYRKVERLLRRRGLEPRVRSQTLGDYADTAAQRLGQVEPDLEWFKRAAWVAAYDPAGPTAALARDAIERLSLIKRRGPLTRP